MLQLIKTSLIRALGGFPTVQDAIDEIQAKGLGERTAILTLAVRRLYNTIGPDDILREDAAGNWILEGRAVSDGVKKLLVSEAAHFQATTLWRVLRKDIQYKSNRLMFVKGKTEMDLAVGKIWLFSLDATSTRLASMAKGRGTLNTKDEG